MKRTLILSAATLMSIVFLYVTFLLGKLLMDIFPMMELLPAVVCNAGGLIVVGLFIGYFRYFNDQIKSVLRKLFWGVVSIIVSCVLILAAMLTCGIYRDGAFAPRLPAGNRLSDSNLVLNPISTAPVSNTELLGFARSYIDKDKMMFKEFTIGRNNGYPIKVSYPCSDICPQNTIRIIRYDVPVAECNKVGGVLKEIYVPFGLATSPQEFCFPKTMVDNKIYRFAD